MSLQGSLDTFALPDVLVLLASTKKSGELHVAGNRGPGGPRTGDLQGRLWLDEGHLVGFDVAGAADAPTAVFELLRLEEGSFSFVAGAAPNGREPIDIEPVLGEAQALVTEWREIEKVVPSLAAWLRLAPEAPAAHVSMRAEQWRLVVAIGSGCAVANLVDRLGHGELGGCRSLKELAEAGLIDVIVGEAEQEAEKGDDPAAEPETGSGPGLWSAPTSWSQANLTAITNAGDDSDDSEELVVDGLHMSPTASTRAAVGAHDESAAPGAGAAATDTSYGSITDFDSLVTLPPRARESRSHDHPAASAVTVAAPRRTLSGAMHDRDERDAAASGPMPEAQALARHLATLSDDPVPSAPTSDAAGTSNGAAGATGAGAAGAEDLDADEPLNRGLLLKFLSSVRN